jgi:hypothetical protein
MRMMRLKFVVGLNSVASVAARFIAGEAKAAVKDHVSFVMAGS